MRAASLTSSAIFALLLVLPEGAALAQGSDTSTGLTQSRRQGEETGKRKTGPVTQVGAGTTEATTTGHSGEAQDTAPKAGDKLEVPPVPSAELCKEYENSPGHRNCLEVVLPKKAAAQ